MDSSEELLCNTEQEQQQLGALVWCSLVLVLGGLGKIRIDPPSSRQGEAAAAVQTIALSGPETAYFYLSGPGPGHMSLAATQWSNNNDGFVSKATV